jgi:hypothetical protein
MHIRRVRLTICGGHGNDSAVIDQRGRGFG